MAMSIVAVLNNLGWDAFWKIVPGHEKNSDVPRKVMG